MLKLAFVQGGSDDYTWNGNNAPPPENPDPDPPRRGSEYLSSDWSMGVLTALDMIFLVWSWADPTPCLRWLPMVPTGLAAGGLLVLWLASLIDESEPLHAEIWQRMKGAMAYFTVITTVMPGAVRLIHLWT